MTTSNQKPGVDCGPWGIAIVVVLFLAFCAPPSAARADAITEAGDALQIALPTMAFASTLLLRDWQGTWQFAKQGGGTLVLTHGTKFIVDRTRPDGSNSDSFPSGHTSAAFLGPSFVHRRYGWKWAIPMYAGAIYVGYSRIYGNKHFTDDVFVGASIPMLMAWLFVRPRRLETFDFAPLVGRDVRGMSFSFSW